MNIETLYLHFDEDKRLNQSNAGRIEYETTMIMLKKYLRKDMKILELGAASGLYTLSLAKLGYDVCAVELLEHHLDLLKSKIMPNMKVTPVLGDAQDLSFFEQEQFDIVLCLGPLYHLDVDGQIKCMKEIHRVLKKDGIAFCAYLNNHAVFTTETMVYNNHFLESDLYNHTTMKLIDKPFVFFQLNHMSDLLKETKFTEIKRFAQDGIAELCADRINDMSELQFQKWMKFHLTTCDKTEMLGYSNHIISIARKGE